MKDRYLIHDLSHRTYKPIYKKVVKAIMITTQQYIKLNTGAKEIQQLNQGGPDNSQSIRP